MYHEILWSSIKQVVKEQINYWQISNYYILLVFYDKQQMCLQKYIRIESGQ